LVEVLVALLLSLMVYLAVLETAVMSMHTNLRNAIRDEAVNVADISMNEARDVPFGTLATTPPSTVTRNFRGVNRNYTVTQTVTTVNGDNKQVNVTVTWPWRGKDYTHSILTLVRKTS
jgi:hypothetical protein